MIKNSYKKSFILFLTITIVGISSIVFINYYQINSFKIKNLSEYKTYIQAKNHMSILKEISVNFDFDEELSLQNSEFKIYALKKDEFIHYFVESTDKQIKLYEKKDF
ncbi:MAG: hypothetical protein ABF301_00645 [Sulfurovum sp.]|jgi:hypothetical protein|nr:MAG: Uncharacterised protein [Arcobacter lacus]